MRVIDQRVFLLVTPEGMGKRQSGQQVEIFSCSYVALYLIKRRIDNPLLSIIHKPILAFVDRVLETLGFLLLTNVMGLRLSRRDKKRITKVNTVNRMTVYIRVFQP